MRKKMRISAVLLAAAMPLSFGMFAGCTIRDSKVANNENTLQIECYNRGYGTEGYQAIADRFMELNPDTTILLEKTTSNTLNSTLLAGPEINTVDMYLYGGTDYHKYTNTDSVVIAGTKYDSYLEPLNEVYEHIPEGETLSIKDKMYDDYEQFHNMKDGVKWTEDTYYTAPVNTFNCGFVYNSKIFADKGFEVPSTTDELIALAKQINQEEFLSTNKNSPGQKISVKAFTFCRTDSYWQFMENLWWAQYDGYESFTSYFKGQDIDGNHNPVIAASDGRWYLIELLDELLGTYKKEGGQTVERSDAEIYCDPTTTGKSFIDSQATFLNGLGALKNDKGATTALIMPNGDWVENEMYVNFGEQIESGELEFKYMKTPVISAIIKHPDCSTIENDAELSALIEAIDNGSTALSGTGYEVDQKAYDKIFEARTMETSHPENMTMMVPVYSNAKELAKKFLKFMYSDEALEIYAKTTRGQDFPFKFDYASVEGVSKFHQSRFEAMKNVTHYVAENAKSKVCHLGGLSAFMVYSPLVLNFNVSSERDYVDPTTVFIKNCQEIEGKWSSIMRDSGVDY